LKLKNGNIVGLVGSYYGRGVCAPVTHVDCFDDCSISDHVIVREDFSSRCEDDSGAGSGPAAIEDSVDVYDSPLH
jgi:hypothetical protein